MTGRQTDVTMVIKAREEAGKAILTVADAIKTLTGAQEKLSSSSGATSSLLEQLKVASLGLVGAVQKTDSAVDKAAASLAKQQKNLAETEAQLSAVKVQMEAAERAAATLNTTIAAGGKNAESYKLRLEGVTAEQARLSVQAKQLTSSITAQQAALAKSATTLQQMRSSAGAAGSAATFAIGAGSVSPQQLQQAAEGVRRLASSLPPIAPAAQQAAAGTRSLWTQLKETTAAFFAMPSAAQRATAATAAFGDRSAGIAQAIRLFRYELLSMVFGFIGPYGLINAIGSVLTAYQSFQGAQNRLAVAFNGDTQKVGADIAWLREQSIRLGISFSVLLGEYSKFAIAAQAANFSTAQTRRIFLSVAEAGRVAQLSTEQVSGVFLALTQMISKGKVQSEELRRQLGDRLSGAFQIFADALGVSTAKLDKMMRQGEIFADQDTLGKLADKLDEKYGKQLPAALGTTQAQIGRLRALMEQAAISIGQGGFISQLGVGIAQLNKYLQTDDARRFFTQLGALLGRIISLVPIVVRNFGLITTAFKAWLAVKIDLWLLGLVGKFGTVAAAARAFWAAIGGGTGLIITGVAFALETVLGKWITSVDGATAALDEHARHLEKIKEGYDEAAGKVENWAKKIKDVTEVQILANLTKLKNELATAQNNLPSVPQVVSTGSDVPVFEQDALGKKLDSIIDKFRRGKASYEEFRKAVSDFGVANPQYQDFAAQLLDIAKKYGELLKAVKEGEAELRLSRGKGTPGDLKTLGLDASTGFDKARDSAEGFADTLRSLGDIAPDLKKQFGFEDQINKATTIFLKLIDQAANDPVLLARAIQMYSEVVAKVHALAAKDAASAFPVDNKAIIERIIYVESGGKVTARNPNSSAFGIGQFTNATWLQLFDQVFPKLADWTEQAKLAQRANADAARQVLEAFTRQNQVALALAGVPVTAANTYLAHFLGASGAIKMILANPDELASKIAGASATRSNPSILGGGRTVADVLNFAATKMGGASPILSTGETQIEKVTTDLNDQIKAWQDDAKAAQDASMAARLYGEGAERSLFIQKQISEWTKKFADAGGGFPPGVLDSLKQAAGYYYDISHQAQNAQTVIQQISALSEQYTTAAQELQRAFSDGSSAEEVDALKKKVAELGETLRQVLPIAQSVAASIGDQKMVETLEKAAQALATVKTGLTDARQMNTLIADGIVSAWGNFNTTLGQTRKVFVALRTALLQFALDFVTKIEEMILKQQVLNALSGTGIGKFLSGAVNDATGTGLAALNTSSSLAATAVTSLAGAATAATAALQTLALSSAFSQVGGESGFLDNALTFLGEFHEGGIVGRDGRSRAINAAVFAGAQRFHRGGLPGLRRGEVPAILERGEEVLRRNDPRHVLNGGVGQDPIVKLKNVNVFDHGDVFSHGLNTEVGEKAFLNFVGKNRSAIKTALG
ncbi:MAG: tape measure protein [Alphaproteobacteria bacterium]|nr:tape measure protein [Alphaproteobacteria bacterium]